MIKEIDDFINQQNKMLGHSSEFKSISLAYDMRDEKIALKCCYTDIYDCKDKVVNILRHENVDSTINAISEWINHITEGVRTVRELNNIIKDFQKEASSSVRVIYKFGYSFDNNVKIIDWDFNKIVIKLNKNAVCKLIQYENNLNDILNFDEYRYSLVSLVQNFNYMKLHKMIGATVEGDIINVLTANMLSRADIIKLLTEKSTKGVQKIKSVFKISELGLLALFIWNIDFDAGVVDTVLVDDKILNVNDDTFIRDEFICKALHNLYEIKAKEMLTIFNKEY